MEKLSALEIGLENRKHGRNTSQHKQSHVRDFGNQKQTTEANHSLAHFTEHLAGM
jgi:hypothetical protein